MLFLEEKKLHLLIKVSLTSLYLFNWLFYSYMMSIILFYLFIY